MNTLPTNLPPLPKGAVYLGLGGTFDSSHQFFEGWALRKDDPTDTWEYSLRWGGESPSLHHCAPADSEVVKLNAKPETPPQYLRVTAKEASAHSPQDWASGMFYVEGPDHGKYSVILYQVLSDGESPPVFRTNKGSYQHLWKKADSEAVKLNQKYAYTPLKQEFIIWCPERGEPTTKHPTIQAATAEARRLAAKHPAKVFHVCQIVAAYVGEVTVKKTQ